MSLLLDALKSTDSGSAQATELESMEPKPMEPDEEPLDAHATLRLLAPRAAPGGLALEPMSGNTTNSTAAAPKLAADAAPAAPPVLAPIIERLADRR